MGTKQQIFLEESSKYIKVKASVFQELQEKGYQYVVTMDAVPDHKSGFNNSEEGVLNIECIPYKEEPLLQSRHHRCYILPSNKLREMICNEVDYIIHKKYLSISKRTTKPTVVLPLNAKSPGRRTKCS